MDASWEGGQSYEMYDQIVFQIDNFQQIYSEYFTNLSMTIVCKLSLFLP